jgi:hypothetical protein
MQYGVADNVSSYIQCTPFNGTAFGPTVTSGLVDWGYAGRSGSPEPSARSGIDSLIDDVSIHQKVGDSNPSEPARNFQFSGSFEASA